MGRITSSTGLVTGLPIEETVKKLMQVASQPKTILENRTKDLTSQQGALDALGSRLLAFQFAVNKLKSDTVYNTRNIASSNPTTLTATAPATGTPSIGTFQVQPVRAASSQTLVSRVFDDLDGDLGDGKLRIGFGGFVDQGISLAELNSGSGVPRGKIKITDRSGVSAIVDLRHARTVDDVLEAINSNGDAAVTAAAVGDTFVLTDGSGGSGNLAVSEVGGGTTAAGLGLAGVSVASNTATGADVLRLHAGAKLASLNDGRGVRISAAGVKDLDIDLSDGTSLQIDLAGATTLGEVITKINAASPNKLAASIAADGNRLTLTDSSGGVGAFTVADGVASSAASDLGIVGTGSGGVLTGDRLISGLRDSLVASLNGGAGLGQLGQITITDRTGASAGVNLSAAETLGDVVGLINATNIGVTAAFNDARNGIVVTDESSGNGNLIIANADSTKTADALGLTVNGAVGSADSGALHRQTISKSTLLSTLNGGKGITLGDIKVTDAAGVAKSADLNPAGNEVKTVGDVIDRINALNNGVEARINDNGDGVLLVNTASGSAGLKVQDLSGNIAASLNLTRASKTIDIDGQATTVIDGSRSFEIDLSDLSFSAEDIALSSLNGGDGIDDGDIRITNSKGDSIGLDLNGVDAGLTTIGQLVDRINAQSTVLNRGITASVNSAGTGLTLHDSTTGSGKLKVENVGNGTSATDLKLTGASHGSTGDQTIDGGATFSAGSGAQTGLKALADRINDQQAGVTASTVFDGAGYRLSLAVTATGEANQLQIDAPGVDLNFEEVSKAHDALLLYGNLNSTTGGVLLNSPDGNFAGSVGGVDVKVLAPSDTPVSVTVSQTDDNLVSGVKDFISAYNSLRKDLGSLTSFDAENLTTGLLFGTNEALQIDQRLSRALTDRYFGFGQLQSLQQIGISVNGDGTLALNETKLTAAYEKDPANLQKFLSDADTGVAAKLGAAIDKLAGGEDSLLASRSDAIQATIASNQERIDRLTASLAKQEERLFAQFSQLETLVAKLQQSQSALSALQPIAPAT